MDYQALEVRDLPRNCAFKESRNQVPEEWEGILTVSFPYDNREIWYTTRSVRYVRRNVIRGLLFILGSKELGHSRHWLPVFLLPGGGRWFEAGGWWPGDVINLSPSDKAAAVADEDEEAAGE